MMILQGGFTPKLWAENRVNFPLFHGPKKTKNTHFSFTVTRITAVSLRTVKLELIGIIAKQLYRYQDYQNRTVTLNPLIYIGAIRLTVTLYTPYIYWGCLETSPLYKQCRCFGPTKKEAHMKYQIWNFLGQLYAKTGTRSHVRQDGTITELIVWRTHCAKCGTMFEVMTKENPKYLTRRCHEHTARGGKVKHNALWGQPIPLAELLGITQTTQQPQTKKRTMAMFLEEPATVLTTPNRLEKRHG